MSSVFSLICLLYQRYVSFGNNLKDKMATVYSLCFSMCFLYDASTVLFSYWLIFTSLVFSQWLAEIAFYGDVQYHKPTIMVVGCTFMFLVVLIFHGLFEGFFLILFSWYLVLYFTDSSAVNDLYLFIYINTYTWINKRLKDSVESTKKSE